MHEAVTTFAQTSRTQQLESFVLQTAASAVVLVLLLHVFFVECLSPDGLTLLDIKASFTSDPLNLLSNWNKNDTNPCLWTGVTCDPKTLHVVSLNITGNAVCACHDGSCEFDGYCSLFQSCPSLLWQGPYSQELLPTETAHTPICLCKEGSNITLGSLPNNGAPCMLTGSISPAIGNLLHLKVVALPFIGLSGVLPKEISALIFLEVLDLQGNAFSGSIIPEIGRLSRLKVLNLAFNSFKGEIPSELSSCRFLQVFNVAGNMLSGKIPLFFGNISTLRSLVLSYNQLDGNIPEELGTDCGSLQHLHLEGNFLLGRIPPAVGNCSRLKSFMISSNLLTSSIPVELGQLGMLEILDVSRNTLYEDIPSELGNCTRLSMLVLTNLLDPEKCINRTMFDQVIGFNSKDKGEYNYFTGSLPSSITSLPNLRVLWAPRAFSFASFPSYWGSCSSLEVLNLAGNLLSGGVPLSLARCQKLIFLDMGSSSLEGSLPQLPVHCMVVFNVSGNFLSGNFSAPPGDCPTAELLLPYCSTSSVPYVPTDAESSSVDIIALYFTSLYYGTIQSSLPVGLTLQALTVIHDLSQNNFTGPVPMPPLGVSLRDQKPGYVFLLAQNQFNGTIPDYLFDICQNIQQLAISLSHNNLYGTLPVRSMQDCSSLRHFEAASNDLSESISPQIQALQGLAYLDLGSNNFTGTIPSQFGEMKGLEYLILANNDLVGTIPSVLCRLSSLLKLDLSQNNLTGGIPEELSDLQRLRYLWLNNNSLSGVIPASLAKLTSLVELDVAYNNLSGAVPLIRNRGYSCSRANFMGNPFLQPCSAHAPAPSPKELYKLYPPLIPPMSVTGRRNSRLSVAQIAVLAVGAVAVVAVCFLLLFYPCKILSCRNCPGYHPKEQSEVVLFEEIGCHLTYEHVVRATGRFSVDYLIGNGGFGATYKAELALGLLFAVKRLSLVRFQGIQQFVAEIGTLGRIRHTHLVTLIGYYASDSEMFLIYNYLPGGNLESLLHNKYRGTISWKVRHKIALNVAEALEYLHNGCRPRVLHRDIKPSNILLDNSMNAYLSDFGLARLLGASETHATTDVAGTFGYVAPEYVQTGRVSDKADVYSYGVVLLELLSGKKALDPSFSNQGNGFNLVAWATHLFRRDRSDAVFAPELWEQEPHSKLVDALTLAVTCTDDSLSERPTMKQVVACLKLCG